MTVFASVSVFSVLLTMLLGSSGYAEELAQRCIPCETSQHAADLASIEKYLQQSDLQTLESLDEEARAWFSKFQEGGMLFDGWQEISGDVVAKVPQEKKIRTKITLLALGMRIGCEWSKENDIRKISTQKLKEWGGALRKTVNEYPVNIPSVIQNIELEVDTLLAI